MIYKCNIYFELSDRRRPIPSRLCRHERDRLLPRRSAERFHLIHCAYVGTPYRATGANRHSLGAMGSTKGEASHRRAQEHRRRQKFYVETLRRIPECKKPRDHSLRGFSMYGGEIGIRTLGTGEGTTDFESVPFGHSGISPTARIITTLSLVANPPNEIFSVLSDACVD